MRRIHQTEAHIHALLQHAGLVNSGTTYSLTVLAGGGSDRTFYRIAAGGKTFICLSAHGQRGDIRPYVSVGLFLRECDIGVPRIFAWDDVRHLVLMEDLGDNSLFTIVTHTARRTNVVALYRRVVTALADLQLRATPHMHRCAFLRNRSFGYEALRWESDYFLECCIRQYCGIEPPNEDGLDHELHRLAAVLANEPRCFMHRDFQSTNIFLTNDEVRIIDFQTATSGLPHYDLAALLYDAYITLDAQERAELIDAYLSVRNQGGAEPFDRRHFVEVFMRTVIQRTMQALGAFSFLGLHKGKHEFIRFIPVALQSLRESLERVPDYPVLTDLVDRATYVIKNNKRSARRDR
ncbi:MAG: phosphotransferase [Desulfobacterota bacterium]|nr:phosphotransferase [Thermodesulfobacteriota bacterium]